MTFKSRTLITGATLAFLATGAVWAQSTAPAAGGMSPSTTAPAAASPAPAEKPMSAKEMGAAFTKADANKDGKLDRLEAENFPGLSARFDQVDADGDKMVSKAELEKAMK
jgi:Rieske Fe-S protein